LLVPPGDTQALAGALAELLDQPDRGARYGRAGRLRVMEHYHIANTVESYTKLYLSMLQNPG
jgi:glycosyltransferase involved in cell wall biosynthesis